MTQVRESNGVFSVWYEYFYWSKGSEHFTFYSQDADLTKVASITQDHKLLDTIICDNGKFPLLDDVHLSANVALLTDVVSWTVDLRLQLQHELHQQTGLAVRKDTNLHNNTRVTCCFLVSLTWLFHLLTVSRPSWGCPGGRWWRSQLSACQADTSTPPSHPLLSYWSTGSQTTWSPSSPGP